MLYIFPKHFIEIHHVSQKIWIITFSILTVFVNLLDVFTFMYHKKTNHVTIGTILSAVFLTWN